MLGLRSKRIKDIKLDEAKKGDKENMDYSVELQKMREKYEAQPYVTKKFKVPFWLQDTDTLHALYEEYEQLFAKGKVYYGYVFRANSMLFKSFPPIDYPALVFY